ncbi:hypothetical protein [Hymenobacter sp. BT730]|uniref:hypothetical protein n=1 Tax=Hymenobacter sp. BT730 TaxID=3063332 RepID=UPI0026E0B1C1|nr:hypothetical protein [Hymenobacter sp. BT730]
MSIFGSSDRPSGTMGGLLSGLFGGRKPINPTTGNYGNVNQSGGTGRKLVTGALLAAGAAYLYNRNKNKSGATPGFLPNR